MGVPLARIKDVIVESKLSFKPVSAVLLLVAASFSGLIAWNALHQTHLASPATAGAATATQSSSDLVVLKYDPLLQDAQRELLALGIYNGPVNGVRDQPTQAAISAYQQLNGIAQTGVATPELVNQMKFAHKVQSAAQFTGSVAPAPSDQLASPAPSAVAASDKAALQAAATKAKEDTVKKVQVVLAGLGYKIKKIDGHVSAETRAAILKYQMDNGLDMSGSVNKELTDALKAE